MTTFSTLDALMSLTQSIPDWNKRLDDLNGQIALRQIELARLTDQKPARSVKNKGSTESLRPKDGEEAITESEKPKQTPSSPIGSPKSAQNGFSSDARPNSPSVARAAAAAALEYNQSPSQAAPQSPEPLTPRASPNALTRQSSQPTPPTEPLPRAPAVLRKRKTESLASGNSHAPKYRTRSMIIVYYDSAVQTAFEELVKFVSGNRNAMRKGKMAAKMAEMRRAAEMEAEEESDDESESEASKVLGSALLKPSLQSDATPNGTNGDTPSGTKLNFPSSRKMGSTRDRKNIGNTMNVLRGYRRAGGGSEGAGNSPNIFDELDKGLEWCQGQCEHAAHQFLRDGECSTEIENIKRRLGEVREIAKRKIGKLREEEALQLELEREREKKNENEVSKEESLVNTSKSNPAITPVSNGPVELEVDDAMEVDDDDGDGDDNNDGFDPRKLIFKRSGDRMP
ncbi:uncharacterized protein EAF01_006394 [Botrytis porri]|uniref:Uncharacterized protein n=1 Tax=Botrytis porri TaxID=87229 RepID=A0A4Z1K627_9HELO|nr:uncharacterized protein EAF01_006394 [Botrytis porri]KAF7903345.1 hypothetical protein EAF01_006394 [Botrytis porri]TGO81591.1 hypothetical protein BPOR_1092g00030 [Botrytis porri]